jgi:hypothetical protein
MLGLLAILEFYYRPDSTRSVASNPPITLRARRTEPWLTPAVSLAGLIFSLHQLLSDGSSLIVRSWTGYPITGPVPAQHEAITLIVQASGIALALCAFATSSETESNPAATGFIYSILTSPVWALLGGLGAYIMHTYTDWQSYMGGLILGLVLTSIAPIVVQRAGRAAQARGIARVFGVTWFIVPLFDFLDTLTVAYAFASTSINVTCESALIWLFIRYQEGNIFGSVPTWCWHCSSCSLSRLLTGHSRRYQH